MSWAPEAERDLDRLLALVAAAAGSADGRTPVVLIDGPSGAGKSSLADLLASRWPDLGAERSASVRTVRMDDLYPGWDGLDAASAALGAELLEPLATSGSARPNGTC